MIVLYAGPGRFFRCVFGKYVDGRPLFVWTNPQETLGQ